MKNREFSLRKKLQVVCGTAYTCTPVNHIHELKIVTGVQNTYKKFSLLSNKRNRCTLLYFIYFSCSWRPVTVVEKILVDSAECQMMKNSKEITFPKQRKKIVRPHAIVKSCSSRNCHKNKKVFIPYFFFSYY